jgi:branched-chain amino acid transport system substrate-binding protein
MSFRNALIGLLSGAVALLCLGAGTAQAQNEQFIPLLVYRTGPYAPSGIPTADGYRDYLELLNARDHGINGVKIVWEECETSYNNAKGVECYEKLKNKGPTGASLFNPYSTGITYQLIPKAAVDKVPLHSMGYGRTDAADGEVFPWVFNFPTTYWSQASAIIKYVGAEEHGLENLKGKKIAFIYHNSAYGKEPIPTLEALSKKLGYELTELPVDHPGLEQGATWLQIRRLNPDWILMWGWGVMNSVAIKEAASINYPMDHFIGVWWSGSEADVEPAGAGAKGYKSATFHGTGTHFKVAQDVLKYVYHGDEAKAKENHWGEVLYDRNLVNAMYDTEAIRTAQAKYGHKPLTGEQVRWGLEHLNLTQAHLDKLGFGDGMLRPIHVTCADHETGGPIRVQQWDGKEWKMVSDWISPMEDVVRPMIEESAMKYAAENHITPRSCK